MWAGIPVDGQELMVVMATVPEPYIPLITQEPETVT